MTADAQPIQKDERGRSPRRRVVRAAVLGLALVLGLSGCYRVALFGDMPYSTSQEGDYQRLLQAVNDADVTFSAHVGDFQASTSNCTDAVVQKNIDWFDSLDHPLIFTPGDNDWTDCSAPTTRLARLRTMIYRDTGTASRGRTTRPLTSQPGYPENARWTEGPITYVTIHVVGSSDGQSNKAEFDPRRAANISWLHQAFDQAKARSDRGVVVITQSGLRFERAEGDKGAYETMFQALRTETTGFAGEVLYVHGDGHTFTDDHPMRTATGATVANLHRVEVPGGAPSGWVQLTVNPDAGATLFTINLQSN
ncbi:hypothetical protein [Aquihabitans sp. McL0605]|uniref:hypothetical protein n=1 Tax=Aquihabitans sp. McL0605 TaxID=3415671 RepID=UPI003CE79B77